MLIFQRVENAGLQATSLSQPEPEAWQAWTKMLFIPQECSDLTVTFLCWLRGMLSRKERDLGLGLRDCQSNSPLYALLPLSTAVGGNQELHCQGNELTMELQSQEKVEQDTRSRKIKGARTGMPISTWLSVAVCEIPFKSCHRFGFVFLISNVKGQMTLSEAPYKVTTLTYDCFPLCVSLRENFSLD